MTHTPGPWRVRKRNYIGRQSFWVDPVNARSRNDSVCVAVIRTPWPIEESEANAHLIAASPTMLEALQVIAPDFDLLPKRIAEIARAAIAAATKGDPHSDLRSGLDIEHDRGLRDLTDPFTGG